MAEKEQKALEAGATTVLVSSRGRVAGRQCGGLISVYSTSTVDLALSSDNGKCQCLPNRNIGFALLQTQGSFAAPAKLMLNLHKDLYQKKETGRCPGGNTTGVPRLRGVWGKSWVQNTSYHDSARMAQWS
jgi:hypothetical protein